MANKKTKKVNQKKPKSTVAKQNQFRTEYKDRISSRRNSELSTNVGSSSAGPSNSLILIPEALTTLFGQGTKNGEVDGNVFNPKFLNMKMKINFDKLPPHTTSTTAPIPIQYQIHVRHGYVLQDLREYLEAKTLNSASGRTQPAFPVHSNVPGHWEAVAKKFLFNARIQSEFLSYEKRLDTQVRIIKTQRILGQQEKVITRNQLVAGTGMPLGIGPVSPDRNLTFDWKMPRDKCSLSPAMNSTAVAGYAPTTMWVPFVCVTMNTNVPLASGQHLNVHDISHFTYTDS